MKELTNFDIENIVKTIESPPTHLEFSELLENKRGPAKAYGSLESLKVQIEVLYGTKTLTLKHLSSLKSGEVIALDQETKAPLTLLANGKKVARGEVVAVGDHYGIKITEFEE